MHTLIWTPNGLRIRADHPDTEEARCGWWGAEVSDDEESKLMEYGKSHAATRVAEGDETWSEAFNGTDDAEDLAEVFASEGSIDLDGETYKANGNCFYRVTQWCSLVQGDISVEEMIESAKCDGFEVPVALVTGFQVEDEYAYITSLAPAAEGATT